MRIIVTGGLGFIGSNLIKKLLTYKNNIILNLDSESYCSMPESLKKIKTNKNYFYKNIDLSNYSKLNKIISDFKPNIIFHLAAESHVDNSIKNANNFIYSNIIGTYNLLECCNNLNSSKKFKFIHISTDEVYGSLNNKRNKSFSENSKFFPNSPYSASKAASDLLVRAWNKTYNIPTITTNCVNNFGEWQFPEKLIPVVISCCLLKKEIPVYGNGKNIREWIYVNDHVYQLIEISKKGIIGETYNIGSGYEISNINLIIKICNYFDKNYKSKNSYSDLITFVKDRPAHDFRYSLNSSKVNNLLFLKKMKNFDIYLEKTIDWYVQNSKWLLNKYNSRK